MSDVVDQITKFKNELSVVDAVGLYDIKSQKCTFSDEKTGTWAFCVDFCNQQVAECSESFYLESQGNLFFGHYNNDSLLVVKLKRNTDINRVILELRSSKLHSSIVS